jgi:hypothetical protein
VGLAEARKVGKEIVDSLGRAVVSALPLLTAKLNHTHEAVRIHAAYILSQLDADLLCPLVPELSTLLTDPAASVRLIGVLAFAKVGMEALPLAPAIKRLLMDHDGSVRAGAVWSLSNLGKSAVGKPAELVSALSDDDPNVRLLALNALKTFGEVADVSDLAPLLQDAFSEIRTVAAQMLVQLLCSCSTEHLLSVYSALTQVVKKRQICLDEFLTVLQKQQRESDRRVIVFGFDARREVRDLLEFFEHHGLTPKEAGLLDDREGCRSMVDVTLKSTHDVDKALKVSGAKSSRLTGKKKGVLWVRRAKSPVVRPEVIATYAPSKDRLTVESSGV